MIERTMAWLLEVTGGEAQLSPVDHQLCFRGVSTDSRRFEQHQLYVPLVGEHFDGHDYVQEVVSQGATAVIWQHDHEHPELDVPIVLVKDTLVALQQMAHRYRQEVGIPVVAITGSNGKTTTKDLIATSLSSRYRVHKTDGNYNNHIGVPLTILAMSELAEIAVIEMGMNHAGEIALLTKIAEPDVAVITNIGESHIGFLGSRAGIAEAKLEIKEGLRHPGKMVINGDEPLLTEKVSSAMTEVIRIGWSPANDDRPIDVELNGTSGIRFRSQKSGQLYYIPLLGRHNAYNCLLAIEVGRQFGCSEVAMAQHLEAAQICGGRLEIRQARNGMMMIDDTYNASPTSMRAALDLQLVLEPDRQKWALFSDIHEIGAEEERFHREVGAYAVKLGVKRIYTVGERGRWIYEGALAADALEEIHIEHLMDHREVIQVLQREGNENVLLLVKASNAAKLKPIVDQLT